MITIGDLNGARNITRSSNPKVYPNTKNYVNESLAIISGSAGIALGVGIVVVKLFDFFSLLR